MGRRKNGRNVNGIVLLDKEIGGSSNHVLQQVRRLFQANKAGHTGALDPLASGMLPICLGEATKFSGFLLDSDKTYDVTAKLGERTTTSDADGEVVQTRDVTSNESDILTAISNFTGKSKQIPSMFSALKYQGKPLYVYARQGITVPREARDIEVFSITKVQIDLPFVSMQIHCSKGTYIRTIVDDLGEQLGCGAYVTHLHRTQVASFPNDQMISMAQLEAKLEQDGLDALDALLLPMDTAAIQLPKVTIASDLVTKVQHGQAIAVPKGCSFNSEQLVRMYEDECKFLGVGAVKSDGLIHPKRLVVYE